MACTSCACARWTSHGLSRGDKSERELSWCRKRRVLCSSQVQQCTEKPLLSCVCKQLQDTGVFFYASIPQKTAVALGLDPQTTTCIYPLSINTRCRNRIFAAPRTSSHGSGARGAALLLPLSMPILTVSNSGQVLRGYMSRIRGMCGQPPPPTRRLPAAYGAPALRSLWCCTGFVLCPSACSRGRNRLEGPEAQQETKNPFALLEFFQPSSMKCE